MTPIMINLIQKLKCYLKAIVLSEQEFYAIIHGNSIDTVPINIKNYYQMLYHRWQKGDRLIWNWSAFFSVFFGFGVVWFLYRRLYLFSFVIHLITNFVFLFTLYFFQQYSIEKIMLCIFFINAGLAIFSGLFSNALLMTWLGSWKRTFPKKEIPSGGDNVSVLLYFGMTSFTLMNNFLRFKGLTTVAFFSLYVLCHYYYYERESR